jgi:hypothetical protein
MFKIKFCSFVQGLTIEEDANMPTTTCLKQFTTLGCNNLVKKERTFLMQQLMILLGLWSSKFTTNAFDG